MTDNEIVKALECCILGDCQGCFYGETDQRHCRDDLMQNALDLINRLQADVKHLDDESDALRADIDFLDEELKTAEAEISVKNKLLDIAEEKLKKIDIQLEVSKKIEKEIKAEAYKEFAEMLKERAYLDSGITGFRDLVVDAIDIDNLLNELVGE